MTRPPLSREVERLEQIEMFDPPPVGDSEILENLFRKWSKYETGLKPTALGAVYGAQTDLADFHRAMTVRPGCRRQSDDQQKRAWFRIRNLIREGKIVANPEILRNINNLGE